MPTGSIAACVSAAGVYDLSGNAKEWTDDVRGTTGPPDDTPIAVVRGGGYDSPAPGLTCGFDLSRAAITLHDATIGFRCCSDTPP